MNRLHTAFVLGYHGCRREVGESVLRGETVLRPSENEHDWLGHGIYFWEADPRRAREWASARYGGEAFVVGGVIDLAWCLDLMSRESLEMLAAAHAALQQMAIKTKSPLPRNEGGRRNLDCAIVNHLHELLLEENATPFDTVRGLFWEGQPLFEGSGFFAQTHVQIVVRSPASLKGLFRIEV